MMTSEHINEVAGALAKAQGEIQNPHKASENPHYRSRYADLAGGLVTIRPTLAKHGLSVVQMTHLDGDMVTLHTRLLHSSGQWLESVYPVCRTTDHQKMGSALTYSRRYALFALVGVAGDDDDDDGNSAATARGGAPKADKAPAPAPAPRDPTPYAEPRKSSAALKREDIWPALEKAVRESPDIDTLTMLWDDKADEASRWPQTWRDAWWDMVEARTKELEGKQAAE